MFASSFWDVLNGGFPAFSHAGQRFLFNFFNKSQVENNFLELRCSKRPSVMQKPHHISKSWQVCVSTASQSCPGEVSDGEICSVGDMQGGPEAPEKPGGEEETIPRWGDGWEVKGEQGHEVTSMACFICYF